MDITNNFNDLKGWINYCLSYEDGSEGIEQFEFTDFWSFRHLLSKHFLDKLKNDYDYDDIVLKEVHFQDLNNKFHLHMTDGYMNACCHNEINSELIDKNYKKKLTLIKDQAEKTKSVLEQIIADTN